MESAKNKSGIRLLVKRCRDEFRCPENTDYYAEEDYHEAERKFVKLCLLGMTSSDDVHS